MIVRSIRLVQFEGVSELGLKDLPLQGVVDPAIPPGAPSSLVGDAIRFALTGGPDDAERVVTPGRGYAHVEVGLSFGGGDASLFRGVDRRGSHQVSLREDDGRRVTGGVAEVRRRLEELVGAPLDLWERAVWIDAEADVDPFLATEVPARRPLLVPPLRVPVEPPAAPAAVRVAARETAELAVDALRRALRADELAARVGTETASLLDFASRLRRERTQTSVDADAAGAERDRVRARVRRVREYRDLVAQERAVPQRRVPAAVPVPVVVRRAARPVLAWGLGAAVLLAGLVWVRSDDEFARERWLGALLGAGFLGCLAGYVAAASRRALPARATQPASVAPVPAPAAGEWRAALRQRFVDLGDPDDPAILDDLGRKLAAVDARIEPLRRRLEKIDEAVAACEVESGRVAKVTHAALVAPAEAATGLLPAENLADAVARAGRLGDAVYHSAVERDALIAGGAPGVDAAVDAARAAVRALGDAAGDSWRAEEILREAGLAGDAEVDFAELSGDLDLCVRLVEEVAALGTSPRPAAPPPLSVAAPPETASPAATDDVAAALGDVVGRIAGGREFVLVQSGRAFELRLQGPADPRPLAWAALPEDVRRRISFALRLRRSEKAVAPDGDAAAGNARRCVVLSGRPDAFVGDADIAEFVRLVAPRIEQVVVGSAGTPPPAAAERTAAAAAPLEEARERGVTPR